MTTAVPTTRKKLMSDTAKGVVRISEKRLARYRQREDEFVRVGTSQILKDALGLPDEKGLFAKVDIPRGTVIGVYYGPLYTTSEINRMYGDGLAKFVLCSEEGYCRDCADETQSTLMRLINSNWKLGRKPSVKFCDRDDKQDFLVRAIRDIRAGEELLVDYGTEYWS
jgi:hypothetical protein